MDRNLQLAQRKWKKPIQNARHFDPIYPNHKIKQPLVSTWVNDETKWCEQWEKMNCQSDWTAKHVRQREHPEVTKMMVLRLQTIKD